PKQPPKRRPSSWPWVAVLAMLALLLGVILVARLGLGAGSTPPATSPSSASSPSSQLLTIPPVSGLHQDQATQELAAAGLQVPIVHIHQQDTEPNTVIRTDPPAGTAVPAGTLVTVYVESPGHDSGQGDGGGHG